ncbi:hypothetical protein J6590_066899 [Homalodisca vitripennis]|nr:hypothetical protein J6590_066899 [Homalodisca vitripennis]
MRGWRPRLETEVGDRPGNEKNPHLVGESIHAAMFMRLQLSTNELLELRSDKCIGEYAQTTIALTADQPWSEIRGWKNSPFNLFEPEMLLQGGHSKPLFKFQIFPIEHFRLSSVFSNQTDNFSTVFKAYAKRNDDVLSSLADAASISSLEICKKFCDDLLL